MCYERNNSMSWALGRRGHILSCKRTRPPDVCQFLDSISIVVCSRPPLTLFRLKRYPFHGSLRYGWLAAIVEPFLQYFSNDSLQRHLKDTFQKGLMMAAACCIGAAVRWMACFYAIGFVLIVSSCISHNERCYEKNKSLL